MMSLASCWWIQDHRGVLITGPTSEGKTSITCALARKAYLEGYTAIYKRLPDLLREELAEDKANLLVLDDWG